MASTRSVSVLLDASGLARALAVPVYELRVVKGPDKGKHQRVCLRRLLIGTGQGAHFKLADPTVSAVHCELLADSTGFRVRDLGAKNGVQLGGHRVSEAWLEVKDDLVLGNSVLRFKLLEEDAEETPLEESKGFAKLKGSCLPMRELYGQLKRAAQAEAPVLLNGETGTGKELAAEALVSEGPRRDGPLVVVDCGRLVANLAEAELFGHEAGSFTGAHRRVLGAFERAHRGTLFLDEVGELPLELQPKLLGVLERRVVQRVGGTEAVPVDVRVISATHRDLERAVNRGTFRADLFFRLAAVQLRLPALRERGEDIPALVAHFLDELPGKRVRLAPGVLQRLYDAEYPGNVRELRSAVERAALGMMDPVAPSKQQLPAIDAETPFRVQKERLIESFERAYVKGLLELAKGNVSEAARQSGINRVQLHALIRRLGL